MPITITDRYFRGITTCSNGDDVQVTIAQPEVTTVDANILMTIAEAKVFITMLEASIAGAIKRQR